MILVLIHPAEIAHVSLLTIFKPKSILEYDYNYIIIITFKLRGAHQFVGYVRSRGNTKKDFYIHN